MHKGLCSLRESGHGDFMTRKHFFIYDFCLPLFGILMIGFFLSEWFAESLLHALDRVQSFGFGTWFGHHALREVVWVYSQWVFAIPPALVWLLWFRLNVEVDFISGQKRLDRPLFKLVAGFFNAIEDGGEMAQVKREYQLKIARLEDHYRQLHQDLLREECFDTDATGNFDGYDWNTHG